VPSASQIQPACLWRARHHTFSFPRPTLVMGIVNVTPDSFSDGGRFVETDRAVEHGLKLLREGADILDVGGESTRPGAAPVPEDVELNRVIPVIRRLADQTPAPISIDTYKPGVAARAIAAGATMVNDIAAARADPRMAEVIATTGAAYIALHMQGSPESMQQNPVYSDVVAEVKAFFAETIDRLRSQGVAPEQIALDPGIGFGKTLDHNLELLANGAVFRELGRPLVVGASRKSFIGRLSGAEIHRRAPGGIAAACLSVAQGVALVRTHDVAETAQALRVAEAILAHAR
jgi:dihydropteroate synthase